MRYSIKVKPKSGKNQVEQIGETLKVSVTAAAEKGEANEKVIEVLAKHFGVSKSRICILKGAHSRNKIVEVDFYKCQMKSPPLM